MSNSYPNEGVFLSAVTNHKYLSADGVEIKEGDSVYQLSKLDTLNIPILRTYKVLQRISDGRIHINGTLKIENSSHTSDIKIAPHTVYVNPVDLVKQRLIDVKYQLEVELPTVKQAFEQMLVELGESTDIEVGRGLSESVEI